MFLFKLSRYSLPLKASFSSSSESVSFIFLAIIDRNSGKSIVPFPDKYKIIIGQYYLEKSKTLVQFKNPYYLTFSKSEIISYKMVVIF